MMTFRLRLRRISKLKHTRLKFDLENLKDPNVLETFQATDIEEWIFSHVFATHRIDMPHAAIYNRETNWQHGKHRAAPTEEKGSLDGCVILHV